jgi:23S rRNA (pseudouridine1915-N3)-methyltransferase
MKKIIILSIGGVKEKYYQEAISEYQKRMGPDILLDLETSGKSFSDKNISEIKKNKKAEDSSFLQKNKSVDFI